MEDKSFLAYFITEDIYIIPESENKVISIEEDTHTIFAEEPKNYVEPRVIEVKGENRKNILILFENTKAEFLTPDEESFLEKVLKSVNLSFDDVALVNLNTLGENISVDRFNIINYNTLISFGVKPSQLVITEAIVPYKITPYNNYRLLFVDNLELIEKDKSIKFKLWNNLKELFMGNNNGTS